MVVRGRAVSPAGPRRGTGRVRPAGTPPGQLSAASHYPGGMFRSLGALVGDLLVVILFVAIGFVQHGTPLTGENIVLVGWPFAVGALLGHLAIRAWRAPFRIWPHGLFVWAITLAAGMAIRTLFGAGTEVSFVIVTAIVMAVGMLGWRAIALWLTRGERAAARSAAVEETQAGGDRKAADAGGR